MIVWSKIFGNLEIFGSIFHGLHWNLTSFSQDTKHFHHFWNTVAILNHFLMTYLTPMVKNFCFFSALRLSALFKVHFIFHFSFFGQSDLNTKKLAVSGKMQIFYTKNKQTGSTADFFVFGHFVKKYEPGQKRSQIFWYMVVIS